MFMPILLAFVLSASPVDVDSTSSEPLKVSVGKMSISGNTITLTKSASDTFECEISGKARLELGSDEDDYPAIAADRIVVSRNAKSETTVVCTGTCRYQDAENVCSSDRMQIRFAKQFRLELSGDSRVQYGEGGNQTVLQGESITFCDGKFNVVGAASLLRGN